MSFTTYHEAKSVRLMLNIALNNHPEFALLKLNETFGRSI